MIDTRTTPLPVETVTPIRPSEAIRLGCLTTTQSFDEAYVSVNGRRACAVGAMALGLGGDDHAHERATELHGRVPPLGTLCPAGGVACPSSSLVHLNDDHRWSRERIASWLESIGL